MFGTVVLHGAGRIIPEHPETKTTANPAEDNRKEQCKPNKAKPNSITTVFDTVVQMQDTERECAPVTNYFNTTCVPLNWVVSAIAEPSL